MVHEGPDDAMKVSYMGILLSESQYNDMVTGAAGAVAAGVGVEVGVGVGVEVGAVKVVDISIAVLAAFYGQSIH